MRAFNPDTGHCDQCEEQLEKEYRFSLDGFRQEFQKRLQKGKLTAGDWTALQERAIQDQLPIEQATAYVQNDLLQTIRAAISPRHEFLGATEEELLQFVIPRFSLPEYCLGTIRESLVSLKPVAVSCVRCGAGVVGEASDYFYICAACGVRALMTQCPHCSTAVQLEESQWNLAIRCLSCQKIHRWDRWNDLRISMGEMAQTIDSDQRLVADASRRTVAGVVLASSAYSLNVGGYSSLEFASDHVGVWSYVGGKYQEAGSSAYRDVNSLHIGGQGAVTTGGGWIGGGFGLTGIVTGALIASALNQATTRHSIETVIYFQTMKGEVILLNNQFTPEHLRIMLSPAFSRIEAAHRTTPASPVNVVEQLRQLGQLREAGTITQEEFQQLKAKLISNTT